MSLNLNALNLKNMNNSGFGIKPNLLMMCPSDDEYQKCAKVVEANIKAVVPKPSMGKGRIRSMSAKRREEMSPSKVEKVEVKSLSSSSSIAPGQRTIEEVTTPTVHE